MVMRLKLESVIRLGFVIIVCYVDTHTDTDGDNTDSVGLSINHYHLITSHSHTSYFTSSFQIISDRFYYHEHYYYSPYRQRQQCRIHTSCPICPHHIINTYMMMMMLISTNV